MGLKYALTAAITTVIILLGIVAYLLLKLAHGEFSCELHGVFNETVIAVPHSEVTDGLDDDTGDSPAKIRHHKKVTTPTTPTSGIPLDGPPAQPVGTTVK